MNTYNIGLPQAWVDEKFFSYLIKQNISVAMDVRSNNY